MYHVPRYYYYIVCSMYIVCTQESCARHRPLYYVLPRYSIVLSRYYVGKLSMSTMWTGRAIRF